MSMLPPEPQHDLVQQQKKQRDADGDAGHVGGEAAVLPAPDAGARVVGLARDAVDGAVDAVAVEPRREAGAKRARMTSGMVMALGDSCACSACSLRGLP